MQSGLGIKDLRTRTTVGSTPLHHTILGVLEDGGELFISHRSKSPRLRCVVNSHIAICEKLGCQRPNLLGQINNSQSISPLSEDSESHQKIISPWWGSHRVGAFSFEGES